MASTWCTRSLQYITSVLTERSLQSVYTWLKWVLSYLITLLMILILSCYYYSAIYLGTVLSNIVCLHTTERYLSSSSHLIFLHWSASSLWRAPGDCGWSRFIRLIISVSVTRAHLPYLSSFKSLCKGSVRAMWQWTWRTQSDSGGVHACFVGQVLDMCQWWISGCIVVWSQWPAKKKSSTGSQQVKWL